jgi:ribose transport system permease protein
MRRYLLGEGSRYVGLAVLCLTLALLAPAFLNPANLINVVRQASMVVVLATGLTMALLIRGIDFSIVSILTLCAVTMGRLFTETGLPWPVVILCGLVIGTSLGLVNGVIVAFFRIHPFMVTYGMMWIAQGFANVVAGGQIYQGFPQGFLFFGRGIVFGIPMPVVVMGVVFLLVWFMLNKTKLGSDIYAHGSNPWAAHLYGINRVRNILFVYGSSGLAASVAAVLYVARLDGATAELNLTLLLPVIAAVVVGGTSLFGGKGGIKETLLGALIMTIITNGMNLLNVSSFLQWAVIGTVIILAVLFDRWAPRPGPIIAEPAKAKRSSGGDGGGSSKARALEGAGR